MLDFGTGAGGVIKGWRRGRKCGIMEKRFGTLEMVFRAGERELEG